MRIYALSVQPSLAVAMCCAPLSFDRSIVTAPRDAHNTVVMIASLGKIVGGARYTGCVTLEGYFDPLYEHRSAANIRESLRGRGALFGPRLWVFEDGVMFEYPIAVETEDPGAFWPVPDALHAELRDAYRFASGPTLQ